QRRRLWSTRGATTRERQHSAQHSQMDSQRSHWKETKRYCSNPPLLIGHEEVSAGFFDHMYVFHADQALIMRPARSIKKQITALRRSPQADKSHVADEDLRRAGCVGTIFKIVDASVDQQSGTVGVKED